MAKSFAVVAFIVSAFCFSYVLAGNAPSDEKFSVEGKIYCDPCQFEFESRLSKPLEGVKVILKCMKGDNKFNVTYVKEGKTDANGMYNIPVLGDHKGDICVVNAIAPTNGACTLIMPNKSNRIIFTNNSNVASLDRYVNPLGFMTHTIDPLCLEVVKELDLAKLDD